MTECTCIIVLFSPHAAPQVHIKEYGEVFRPLFDYTTVPLDTTQCVSFSNTCSAMQAIADGLNARYKWEDIPKTCFVHNGCLTITCTVLSFTIAFSPCEPAFYLSGGLLNNEAYKFTQSRVQIVPRFFYQNQLSYILVDVTLVELQDGGAVGLQVGELNIRFSYTVNVLIIQTPNCEQYNYVDIMYINLHSSCILTCVYMTADGYCCISLQQSHSVHPIHCRTGCRLLW